MNQQYDADVSIVNNNAMHVQTLWSFGLINIQSTEQPLQLGGALLCATMETSITAIAAAVGELQEHWNIESNLVVAEDPPRLLCAGL